MMAVPEMDVSQILGYPGSQLGPAMLPTLLLPSSQPNQQHVGAGVNAMKSENDELGRMAQEGVQETVSNEVFSSYRHKEILPGCLAHPGDIVEAGSLAALDPPAPWYDLASSLPKELIASCQLSSLQLEGVLYGCQRHQLLLPNGQRAGFFIGDGAGVGKGRQIAAIVLDNFARGRKRHIWFSMSTDLIVDARRDIADLGCYIKVIEGCQQLDKETRVVGLPADFKEGVVFSTYATLVSSVQRGGSFSGMKQTRLQQLVNWCGGNDFAGCLIFDECHKAKNFIPGKEEASTKVAMAVATIQRMLPKARVLYCSATGVADVKNMAFMERLGLWGEGAPFRNFEHFLESVQRKGLGVSEMLAMEMKATGMYVSRGLSYKQAEFITVEAPLTDKQRKVYDTAAHVWNELRKSLSIAVSRCRRTNTRIYTQFWSSHQRFFKHLCMGMKVPRIIIEAEEALSSGMCVVIGLQTTGEASMESEIGKNKGKELDGFMSLCREILTRFIEQFYPTTIEGAKEQDLTVDSWSRTAKQMLLSFAQQIQLPDSPLDEIIDRLGGPDKVAEMTGRRGRIVRRSPTGKPHYELRDCVDEGGTSVESLNVRERNMFMDGKKLVAIISDAASTGISLHADLRCVNQRRRVHLTIELPWSADKAVQQLGRSHRSNQASGPFYKLVTTDLGGERRFAAAVARRLQSLGALTKGDRRAATGADLSEFNFDTPYGRNGLRNMYHAICQNELVPGIPFTAVSNGMTLEDFNLKMIECLQLMGLIEIGSLAPKVPEKDAGDIGRFLNRVLGLRVSMQNQIFTYFTECLSLIVQNAKKEGRYSEGLLDIMASSVVMEGKPREVFKDINKGNCVTEHILLKVDRGMSWEQATTRYQNNQEGGKDNGFYISRKEMFGRRFCLLATQKENSTYLFKIARPNTGVSGFDEERAELLTRYRPVDADEAEEIWTAQYEETRDRCMHGAGCRAGPACAVGSRCYRISILCGGIVTLLSILETILRRHTASADIHKSELNIRVVRAELTNGERVIGIRYPESLIPEVERAVKDENIVYRLQQTPAEALFGIQGKPVNNEIKAAQAVVESASPVIAKYLKRALTPPVTIFNFFKPSAQRFNNSDSDLTSIAEVKQCDSVLSETSVDVLVCKEDSSDSVLGRVNQNGCSSGDSEIEIISDSVSTSETNSAQIGKEYTSLLSRKRTLDASERTRLPPKKRQKQPTMMAALARKPSIPLKPDKKAISRCPICQTDFESEATNEYINSHIDNCLIE